MEDAIRLVAAAGFDAIELSPREGLLEHRSEAPPSAVEMRKLRRACEQFEVAIASIFVVQPWASTDDDERAAAVRAMRIAMNAAQELGCCRINTELTGTPRDVAGSRKALTKSVSELLPTVEELNLELILEPHPYDFIESNSEAVDLVGSFDSERVGYLFCGPHFYYLGGDARSMLEYARPHLKHVHIADTFRPSRFILNPPAESRIHQHLDIGQGEVDWEIILEALGELSFDGLATVASFAWNDDPVGSLTRNKEAIDRLLRNVATKQSEATEERGNLDRQK